MPIDFRKRTIIDSLTGGTHQWATGSGSIGIFAQNGLTSENERLYDSDPFYDQGIVWETQPSGGGSGDGGWNTTHLAVDHTKLYRVSVWIRRTEGTGTAAGDYYFGLNNNAPFVLNVSNGATATNPYWQYGDITLLSSLNTWYLFVNHVFPSDYRTGTYTIDRHPDSGYYTVSGGKIGSQLGSNNLGGDAVFAPTTTTLEHRTYHFYATTTSAHLQFFDPRIELCDGSEGTVDSLLYRSSALAGGSRLATKSITKSGAAFKDINTIARGGNKVYTFGDWKCHVFTSSSSFVYDGASTGPALKVDYLIVAGGGGGGGRMGGGGGGGGVLGGYCYISSSTAYGCTVGAGGAGATGGSTPYDGSNGGNSTFNGLTAVGGGGGGGGVISDGYSGGKDGGSGGGDSAYALGSPKPTGGSGTAGQGHDGGAMGVSYYGGSGGGGMTSGTTATPSTPATGGTGTFSTILSRPYYWGAGGGAGGYSTTGGAGGPGGGGGAAYGNPAGYGGEEAFEWGEDAPTSTQTGNGDGASGGNSSGGGGGGGSYLSGDGGDGGDGIVIIRYKYR